ncbi:uncharacterized protein LOC123543452 [Mercenaria mercenaria]|uniref:uncharacterized protein LOC123543452 n=1 Tax=Mercenaria mercenaria TaxID=6596 RepID=UPI00234E89DB|nr:uncharacterized protein LOC123543452 [Mercenaria mercenaria]
MYNLIVFKMKQDILVMVLLLLKYALALNDCNICTCCIGGLSRCTFYSNVNHYCLDGCVDGYFGTRCTHACKSSIRNCLTCSDQTHCTSCSDGYYGQYCYGCPFRCLTCTSSATCYSCKTGYYSGKQYDNDIHVYYNDCRHNCQPNCKSCTSYFTCTECVDGKYNTAVGCRESCNRACKTCTSNNYCTSCPSGKYGYSCENDCGFGCEDRKCDIGTGKCACVPNFKGNKCDQCSNSWYGTNCNKKCSAGCLGNICSRDGDCNSCRTGFTGNKCDHCLKGKYGENCDIPCPRGCSNDTCENNGDCYICKPGFTGKQCDQCVLGVYGPNCDNKCIDNCKLCHSGTSCSKCIDRHFIEANICQPCPSSCVRCSSDIECSLCDSNFYGQICNAKCSKNCKDGTCDKTSGVCLSCVDGFYGDFCDASCPENCADNACTKTGKCNACAENGFYDDTCSTKCPDLCKECHQDTGSCVICSAGYFGVSCEKECPLYCKPGTQCQKSSGSCSECADGYFNRNSDCKNKCNAKCRTCKYHDSYCTACPDGKFGRYRGYQYFHCNNDCPSDCLNKSCDSITGDCTYGCVRGYWGKKCKNECPNNCKTNECLNNGTCLSGCKEGYTGYKCECPINCECDADENCIRCKSGFENEKKECTCSRSFCSDDKCSSCSSSILYIENASCCQCSSTCKNNQCESEQKCTDGCVEGYFGDGCRYLCKNVDPRCSECTTDFTRPTGQCLLCIDGYYPDITSKRCVKCSEHCANDLCSPQNGTCFGGCTNGRWGYRCETSCNQLCSPCTQSDGKCLVCKNGKYLSNCSRPCSANCNATNGVHLCAITNGSCLNGCSLFTKHGWHCELTCSSNCFNQTCSWKTGNCINGCVDNFYGDKCDKICNMNCLTTNNERRCNDKFGHCLSGCLDGFYGNLCDQKCSSNCFNTTCDKQSGECVHGCKTGYSGTRCVLAAAQTGSNGESMGVTIGAAAGGGLFLVIITVVIVVVLVLRRRRRSDKSEGKDMVEFNDNTDNSAVTYSEIVTTGLPHQQTDADAVYAKPNKPKKSANRVKSSNESTAKQTPFNSGLPLQQTDADAVYAMPNKPKKSVDRVKSSNESSSSQMLNNPNYEKLPTDNADIANKENYRKPPIVAKPAPVYDNSAIRTLVATHESAVHSDESSLEIEEDIDIIIASSKTKSVTLADGLNVTESDTYYNVTAVKKRKITLDYLPDFVSKKTKAEFAEEFKQLPPGLIKPYVDSQKRINLSKNRYKGIYPYDETRVVLKESDSDYINASYIDVRYNKRKAYIASIGPTFKYMGDMSAFWIMVWQKKVGKIVMLTKLDEGGAPKCDQYWPEKDFSLQYARIQVTCQSEESYADYTIRSFTIQKGSEKRKIVQVHFTAWPDKGVPDDVTSLVEFRQKVVSTKTELEGPILVHCSAGIGRTGTYIALDSLTEEGEAEGEVDIYAFVRNMREQRVNMMQTAGQYQYLHNALVHTLTFDSKAVEASKFEKYMTSHTDDHLGEMFEKLQASVEQRSDDEVDAVKRNQALRNKNRVGADIPGDRNRPKLYLERKLGSSDYINAVYINSYTTINRYLVAQTPLPDTVVDFLTLLVQEKVSCIVSMETVSVGDKTVGEYYPVDNQTLKKGTFTVKSKREKDTEQYVIRKLEIVHKGKSGTEDVTIPHIQLTQWNENKNIPEEPAKFVQFVKDVEVKYGGNKSKGPILVHCL